MRLHEATLQTLQSSPPLGGPSWTGLNEEKLLILNDDASLYSVHDRRVCVVPLTLVKNRADLFNRSALHFYSSDLYESCFRSSDLQAETIWVCNSFMTLVRSGLGRTTVRLRIHAGIFGRRCVCLCQRCSRRAL